MQDLIKYTVCPLCNETKTTIIRTENCEHHKRWLPPLSTQIIWLSCSSCKHVFREGYYTPEALQNLFKGTNPEQQVGYEIEKQRHISSRIMVLFFFLYPILNLLFGRYVTSKILIIIGVKWNIIIISLDPDYTAY